jgi:hypothetical protein
VAGARIQRAVQRLGPDAEPRAVVRTVVEQFLPRDRERRDAMVLFYAFYTAQLTEPGLAPVVAEEVPRGLAGVIATEIRRAQDRREAPAALDADKEALVLTAALPGIVSGVLVNFHSERAAKKVLDYALDRIFVRSRTRPRTRAAAPQARAGG